MVATTRLEPLNAADAELFAAARLRAARSQPYLATALFAMVPVVRPGFGTFAVDRYWRVYLDMDQAREWGVAATAAVLVHEAHHLVRGHHERARRVGATGERHRDWNLAADAAINDDLVDDGLDLPDPVLPHHLGCRRGGFGRCHRLGHRVGRLDGRCRGSGHLALRRHDAHRLVPPGHQQATHSHRVLRGKLLRHRTARDGTMIRGDKMRALIFGQVPGRRIAEQHLVLRDCGT